jgi:methionine aminopeptidase
VAGTGDDSSTVVVKKKKEQQSKLMRRIKEGIDKAIPDIKKEEDEITTRKKQLKELAKNRNV